MVVDRSPDVRGEIQAAVITLGDALPPGLQERLTARGLAVTTYPASAIEKLADRRAAPSVGADSGKRAPFTAMLIPVEALPAASDEAAGTLQRLRAQGVACILVGPTREDLAESEESAPHAWLPRPVDSVGLSTAIRSALTALSLQTELEQARELASLRDAEARALYEVGTALSAERNIGRLEELILRRCREITTADAGSLYVVDENSKKEKILRFEKSQNDSLEMGFSSVPPMPLTDRSISGYVALTGETLNLKDAYELPAEATYGFNKGFDEKMGYRTKSMLVVPMRNHEGDIIGVIQLINHKRSAQVRLTSAEVAEREVIPFPAAAEEVVDAFAGQAAVALTNQLLIQNIEKLFDGFVRASVTAIEARDPTTSGHSERVAELTVGIAEAVNEIDVGRWKEHSFSHEQIREIRYAGLLHDFGKIGVKENVLIKAKKLYDHQLEIIKLRFGYVRKALEAEQSRRQLAVVLEQGRDAFIASLGDLDTEYQRRIRELEEDLMVVVSANEPTVLAQEAVGRLEEVATQLYVDFEGYERALIEKDELLALSVRKGSLTEDERLEIESHVSHTYRFLSLMPWTRQFAQLPMIAGAHHEKLDGTGYPNHFTAEQIPIQSKMMAIADIYDALTASDRPYKKAVPVEKALDILTMEARDNHIDTELLDVFIHRRVYEIAVTVTMRQAMQAATLAAGRV